MSAEVSPSGEKSKLRSFTSFKRSSALPRSANSEVLTLVLSVFKWMLGVRWGVFPFTYELMSSDHRLTMNDAQKRISGRDLVLGGYPSRRAFFQKGCKTFLRIIGCANRCQQGCQLFTQIVINHAPGNFGNQLLGRSLGR